MTETIRICADPIWPDFEKFNEEDWLKRMKGYGIIGINFLLDAGLELEYEPTKVEPGIILDGMQTFFMREDPEIVIVCNYREDLTALDFKFGNLPTEPISSIPLYDYLTISSL